MYPKSVFKYDIRFAGYPDIRISATFSNPWIHPDKVAQNPRSASFEKSNGAQLSERQNTSSHHQDEAKEKGGKGGTVEESGPLRILSWSLL